jgi:cytochrome P450
MATGQVYHALLQALRTYWILVLLGAFVFRSVYRRYFHPLHHIPGPFLGSISSLWFLWVGVLNNDRQDLLLVDLHKKYGPLVRIRPNTVVFNDPTHLPEYYNWSKSEFWQALRGTPYEIPHGSELDVELHKVKKRRIMGAFTMSQVLKNEASMDDRVMEFIGQLSTKCGTLFDISEWTQWAAFDIAMEMTFGNAIGFVKQGRDIDGLIKSIHDTLKFGLVAGLYPWIGRLLYHPLLFPVIGPKKTDKHGLGAMLGFTAKQVATRLQQTEEKHQDILQWWLDHPDKDGELMSRNLLDQEAFAPVMAGSDTTATTLRTLILSVASNQRVLSKFREEIDAADFQGLLSTPPKFEQLRQHIPYLESLLKESQRVCPVVGMPLFRVVPNSGAQMCGHFLPAGTEVGPHLWAIGYNPRIYGDDVDFFRPERWTEDLSHDPVAKQLRDNSDCWFGGVRPSSYALSHLLPDNVDVETDMWFYIRVR